MLSIFTKHLGKIILAVILVVFYPNIKQYYQENVHQYLIDLFSKSDVNIPPKKSADLFIKQWKKQSLPLDILNASVGNKGITFRIVDHSISHSTLSKTDKREAMRKWPGPLTQLTCRHEAIRTLLHAKEIHGVFFQFIDPDDGIHYGHILIKEPQCWGIQIQSEDNPINI